MLGEVALDNVGDATITETWTMRGKHKTAAVYSGDTNLIFAKAAATTV